MTPLKHQIKKQKRNDKCPTSNLSSLRDSDGVLEALLRVLLCSHLNKQKIIRIHFYDNKDISFKKAWKKSHQRMCCILKKDKIHVLLES